MPRLDFSNYLSPFSWRYGSVRMREIFSERHKYQLWRKIWVALARAQHQAGLVTQVELDDLQKHQKTVNIPRILEIEKENGHDVVAAIAEFAETAKKGGRKIHLGATSMDIVDNTDVLRMKEGLQIIERKVVDVIKGLAVKIKRYASFPCLGYTHLQPAEPTTIGYRLAFYAQDFLTDYQFLRFVETQVKGKGLKGAVGTGATYSPGLESLVMQELNLEPVLISSQTYPRKFDYLVLSLLASISGSAAKFAGDLRLLQSAGFGEWSEPFGKKQVGSSAMPFKRNPVNAEKICSLARYVSQLPAVVWQNATLSHLERTLDDSANRRVVLAEGFLAVDEILTTTNKIIEGLVINTKRVKHNLSQFAPIAATELILLEGVKKGANRQTMHELLRELSMKAWEEIGKGRPNPFVDLLVKEKTLRKYLRPEEIKNLLTISGHIGDAPERARKLVKEIRRTVLGKGSPSKL